MTDHNLHQLIKIEYPINSKLIINKKNINILKVVQIFNKIDKLKKHICNEVFNQIFQNIFWKELNVVDIEPINILCTILLLKKLNTQVNKLSHLMIISDKQIALKYKEYISNHLKSPIYSYIIDEDINSNSFSNKLLQIREELNPNMLFFLSNFDESRSYILNSIYKNCSYKDYVLMIVPFYNSSIINSMTNKIKYLLKKQSSGIAFKDLLIKPEDGQWCIDYIEPFFKVNFILKKDIKIYINTMVKIEKGNCLSLIKYYIPKEEKFFSLLENLGFTILSAFNEQTTHLTTLLCQKTKRKNIK